MSRARRVRILAGAGVCLLLSLTCCRLLTRRPRQQYLAPIPADSAFTVGAPDSSALQDYRAAARYSQEHGGTALLVLAGELLVFEDYHNDGSVSTPVHIFSGTKSFSGVLAVAAQEDGLLDLDEPVSASIASWSGDARKRQITIRQLLSFTSGLEKSMLSLTLDGMHQRQRVVDKYAFALELEADHEPGSWFEYSSSHLTVFGALIKQKLGEDAVSYLQRRIFAPIGMRVSGWNRDGVGNPMLPYGAWTTAREWLKFGRLLRDDGRYAGRQILQPGALDVCFEGSAAMPCYGLTFWLNREVPAERGAQLVPQLRAQAGQGRVLLPEGPADLYAAAGFQGNRLYVIPSRNLVIVRLGTSEDGFQDAELLQRLLAPR